MILKDEESPTHSKNDSKREKMPYINIIIPINLFRPKHEMYKFLEEFENKFCDIQNKDFRAFHFFVEDCNSVDDCIEIRIDSKDTDEINSWTKDYFLLNDKQDVIKFLEYEPEIDNFGEGWPIAEKIFEYCSRAAIHIRIGKAINLFRETKFIHCFLNQLGYDSLEESAFHSMNSHQMLIKYFRKRDSYRKRGQTIKLTEL